MGPGHNGHLIKTAYYIPNNHFCTVFTITTFVISVTSNFYHNGHIDWCLLRPPLDTTAILRYFHCDHLWSYERVAIAPGSIIVAIPPWSVFLPGQRGTIWVFICGEPTSILGTIQNSIRWYKNDTPSSPDHHNVILFLIFTQLLWDSFKFKICALLY